MFAYIALFDGAYTAFIRQLLIVFLQMHLNKLLLKKNKRSAFQQFLDKLEINLSQQQHATTGINSIPIIVMQRCRFKTKNYWGSVIAEGFQTVDVPVYIWAEEGTRLTPRMVFEKVYDSIRLSLTTTEIQKEFESLVLQKFADQALICFGATMNFTKVSTDFSEEHPLLVITGRIAKFYCVCCVVSWCVVLFLY
jgi:hypothetical protein